MAVEWLSVAAAEQDRTLAAIRERFPDAVVSVLRADALVPGTGAWVTIADRSAAEAVFLADVLVLVSERVCPTYEPLLRHTAGQAVFISAESKTADIEKKLISGVHGPAECIFVHLQ